MIDVLTIILIAYALATPWFYTKAVKFGVKLGEKPEKVAEEPIFNIPKPKKKPQMTEAEDRLTQILANIDNYNGTSAGQKKVEVKHG